jgi:hypothetical protein
VQDQRRILGRRRLHPARLRPRSPAPSAFRAYALRLGARGIARGVAHCGFVLRPSIARETRSRDRAYGLRLTAHASLLLAPNQGADRAHERDQQRDNARDDE